MSAMSECPPPMYLSHHRRVHPADSQWSMSGIPPDTAFDTPRLTVLRTKKPAVEANGSVVVNRTAISPY